MRRRNEFCSLFIAFCVLLWRRSVEIILFSMAKDVLKLLFSLVLLFGVPLDVFTFLCVPSLLVFLFHFHSSVLSSQSLHHHCTLSTCQLCRLGSTASSLRTRIGTGSSQTHSVPCSSRTFPTVCSNARSRAVRTTRVQSHTSRLSQRSSTVVVVVVVVVRLRGILQSNKCRRSASPTHCWWRRHRALSPTWQS